MDATSLPTSSIRIVARAAGNLNAPLDAAVRIK